MTTVYITEKPSAAKELATYLSGGGAPRRGEDRNVYRGQGWAVVCAQGHLYESANIDYYIERRFPDAPRNSKGNLKWSLDHLPCFPDAAEWKVLPITKNKDKIASIRALLKEASAVVHAGDADREGQRVVDEVLQQLGWKKPVTRVLLKALNAPEIAKAMAAAKDNREFRGMCEASRARDRADGLVGWHFSRLVSIKAQEGGYKDVVSIGRIQTPVLGFIVARELEIRNFKPVDYYEPYAVIRVKGGSFRAKWAPRPDQAGLDAEGRLLDQRIAQGLQQRVHGRAALIAHYKDEQKQQLAPLPFSMASLQVYAYRKLGFDNDKVLKTTQSLYDKKHVTYPRVDTQYLPTSQHADAATILPAALRAIGIDPGMAAKASPSRKSKAFNDSKATAHHAIVPTDAAPGPGDLTDDERRLYDIIARRYIAQFMPPRTYRSVQVVAEVSGEAFKAAGATTIDPGWKALYGDTAAPQEADEATDEQDSAEDGVSLPPMTKGEAGACDGLEIQKKKTTPPPPYDPASLTLAMLEVHKLVTDAKVKAIFEKIRAEAETPEQGGLGTPATRHTFVDKLIDKDLVKKISKGRAKKGSDEKCYYQPTQAGIDLYEALMASAPALIKPDMTALWEMTFDQIEAGQVTVDQFIDVMKRWITDNFNAINRSGVSLTASERRSFAKAR